MKIASLISLVLTLALALACSSPTTNSNTTSGVSVPGLVTVAIVVTQDPAQTLPTVEVTDPTFAQKVAQKIRWCVYNDTAQDLKEVAIRFTGTNPCDPIPSLVLRDIKANNDPADCTVSCGCGASPGSFPYAIDVTTSSGGNPVSPNPRVILN